LRDLPEIMQFQIRQVSQDLTVVRVVSQAALAPASHARIVRDFKARLGAAVEIRVEQVTAIAPEPSGKFRYVLSQVDAFTQYKECPEHA